MARMPTGETGFPGLAQIFPISNGPTYIHPYTHRTDVPNRQQPRFVVCMHDTTVSWPSSFRWPLSIHVVSSNQNNPHALYDKGMDHMSSSSSPPAQRRRKWPSREHRLLPLWTLTLALVALVDAFNCYLEWEHAAPSRQQRHHNNPHSRIQQQQQQSHADDDETCQNPKFGGPDRDRRQCPAATSPYFSTTSFFGKTVLPLLIDSWKVTVSWQMGVGVLFCVMCLGEAMRRTLEARRTVRNTRVLDDLETQWGRRCGVSTTRRGSVDAPRTVRPSSRPPGDGGSGETTAAGTTTTSTTASTDHNTNVEAVVRDTVLEWTPVVSTVLAWFVLIPWPVLWTWHDRMPYDDFWYRDDPSLATLWITRSATYTWDRWTALQDRAVAVAWRIALPFKLWQPRLFIHRLRVLARWARYVRFAGPLFRLLVKLNDQFWVFTRTWRQRCAVQAERAKRLARRSMIFSDIQRIESLARMQTQLASLPSQLLGQVHGIQAVLQAKREQGKKLRRRLAWLKMELFRRSTRSLDGVELYDRVVDLAREVSAQVGSAVWNAHLISPQTRFSVGWRLVVTCTLLSELFRLLVSWELSGTFELRYTDLTRRLLGLCQSKSRPLRNFLGKVLKLPQNHPWLDTCRQSSPSSQLSLQVARMSEIGIDLVGFLDIFVWFYTGELDDMGLIVPKPFFTRCILPGTLTQVLDHPTVPQALPHTIHTCWKIAGTVGYGRVIRWYLALMPAVQIFVVGPVYRYLFRPMDEEEYMTYSESLGLMRTFSSTAPSFLHRTSLGSYSASVLQPVSSLKSIPSHNKDWMDQSLRSLTEDNEGYGLFY